MATKIVLDDRTAEKPALQMAKHTIGVPSLSPLQPLHPPGIVISLTAAVLIFTAMSEASGRAPSQSNVEGAAT